MTGKICSYLKGVYFSFIFKNRITIIDGDTMKVVSIINRIFTKRYSNQEEIRNGKP